MSRVRRRLNDIQNLFASSCLRLEQTVAPARVWDIQVAMNMRVRRQFTTLIKSHPKLLCENDIDLLPVWVPRMCPNTHAIH